MQNGNPPLHRVALAAAAVARRFPADRAKPSGVVLENGDIEHQPEAVAAAHGWQYPADDNVYYDHTIDRVEGSVEKGWQVRLATGLSFNYASIHQPEAGMSFRTYGSTSEWGGSVRGLFVDHKEIYYETEAVWRDRTQREMYGHSAADWLARWDRGESIHTIRIGGLSAGYEQMCQILCTEILRKLLELKPTEDQWTDEVKREALIKQVEEIEKLAWMQAYGYSGSQWGAAFNAAAYICRKGPVAMMTDPKIDRARHQLASRDMPEPAPVAVAAKHPEKWDWSVMDARIGLTTRMQNALTENEIHYVGELLRTPLTTIVTFKNVGVKHVDEMSAKLFERGIFVGTDVGDWVSPRYRDVKSATATV